MSASTQVSFVGVRDFIKWTFERLTARQDSERRITRWVVLVIVAIGGFLAPLIYIQGKHGSDRADKVATAGLKYNRDKDERDWCHEPDLSPEDAAFCEERKHELSLASIHDSMEAVLSGVSGLKPWPSATTISVSGIPVYITMNLETAILVVILVFLWSWRARMPSQGAQPLAAKASVFLLAVFDAIRVASVCAVPILGLLSLFWNAYVTISILWSSETNRAVAEYLGMTQRHRTMMLLCLVFLWPYFYSIRRDGTFDTQSFVASSGLLTPLVVAAWAIYAAWVTVTLNKMKAE